MDSSTPTRRNRERREEHEVAEGSDSRASGEFDLTVSFPLLIPFAYIRAPSRVTTRRWTLPRDRLLPRAPGRSRCRRRLLHSKCCARRAPSLPPGSHAVDPLLSSRPVHSVVLSRIHRSSRDPSPTPHSKTSLPNLSVAYSYRP